MRDWWSVCSRWSIAPSSSGDRQHLGSKSPRRHSVAAGGCRSRQSSVFDGVFPAVLKYRHCSLRVGGRNMEWVIAVAIVLFGAVLYSIDFAPLLIALRDARREEEVKEALSHPVFLVRRKTPA